jgi:DNA replication licensing factor MCM3
VPLCAPQHGQGDYVGRIKEMMARKQTRLLVDANDLRTFDAELARKCVSEPACVAKALQQAGQAGKRRARALSARASRRRLIRAPTEYLAPFEEALEDVVRNQDPKYLLEGQEVKVGFVGRCGRQLRRIRAWRTRRAAHTSPGRARVCVMAAERGA